MMVRTSPFKCERNVKNTFPLRKVFLRKREKIGLNTQLIQLLFVVGMGSFVYTERVSYVYKNIFLWTQTKTGLTLEANMATKEQLLKIRISTGLDELLEELVRRGIILNKSQFVRDLIYTSPEVKHLSNQYFDSSDYNHQFKAEKERHHMNFHIQMNTEDIRAFYHLKGFIFEDAEYLNDYMNFLTTYPQAKLEPRVIQALDYKKDRLEALERKVMSDKFEGYLSDSEIFYFCFHILQFSLAIAYGEKQRGYDAHAFPVELDEEELFKPLDLFREIMLYNLYNDEDFFHSHSDYASIESLTDLILIDQTFIGLKEAINRYYSLDEEGFNVDILANFCVKDEEEESDE